MNLLPKFITNNPSWPIIKQLWGKDWTLKAFIPIALCLVEILIWHTALIGLVFFILLFATLDVVGFVNLTANRDQEISVGRIAYRIVQTTIQILLLTIVGVLCGWWAVGASALAWWFCNSDLLFYILQNDHSDLGIYTWLEGWSVFAILKKLNIRATKKNFERVALIGFIIAAAICLFL